MGIRRAKGDIIGMFCADNYITDNQLFQEVVFRMRQKSVSAVYPLHYHYQEDDNSLNRYFSLIGGNDPVCWWLGKNDRRAWCESVCRFSDYQPSYGCNGFFYRAKDIKSTNLDHYYPMDNAMEVPNGIFSFDSRAIWHRSADTLISFLLKRYKYARDLYCKRTDRRWKMVDGAKDIWGLVLFSLATASIIHPLCVSIRGYSRIKDWAWFWHLPVCWGFLITYGVLTIRWLLSALLFRPWGGRRPLETA